MKNRRKRIFLIAAFYLLFAIVAFAAFTGYRKKLHNEFEKLLMENMTSYTQEQFQQVTSEVEEIENILGAIALLIENSEVDTDMECFGECLDKMSRNRSYEAEYIPMGYLQEIDGTKAVVERLKNHEKNIFDIVSYPKGDEKYYFRILQPIIRNNEITGVLQGLIRATALVENNRKDGMDQYIDSQLMNLKGDIIDTRPDVKGWNLYERIQNENMDRGVMKKIQRDLEESKSGTVCLGESGNQKFYLSYSRLNDNDWCLVHLSKGYELAEYSRTIFNFSIIMVCAIVGVLMLFTGIYLWLSNRQRNRITVENDRYRVLSQIAGSMTFEYDYRKDLLTLSENFAQVFKIAPVLENYKKGLFENTDRRNDSIREFFDKMQKEDCEKNEFFYRTGEGQRIWLSVSTKNVYDSGGQILYTIGNLVDISGHKKEVMALEWIAERDPLTGLYNKKTVEARIDERLLNAEEKGFFFLLDLDHFKTLNDRWGHGAGDAGIKAFAEALKISFRENDILGRVGGDEFVAYLSGCSRKKDAADKAELLRRRVCAIRLPEQEDYRFSVSIGIASSGFGKTYADLFDEADNAMYSVKKQGKNSYLFSSGY